MIQIETKSEEEITLQQECYADGYGEYPRVNGYIIKDALINDVTSNGKIIILAKEGNDFPIEVSISAPEVTLLKYGENDSYATIYPDGLIEEKSGNMREIFSDEFREKFNIPEYCAEVED